MPSKHVMVGALGGAFFDLLIDYPLSQAGVFYSFDLKDETGEWIWGIGTGDIIGGIIAAATIYYGIKKKNADVRDAGLGWLVGLAAIKISELYPYLRTLIPNGLTPTPVMGYRETGLPAAVKNEGRPTPTVAEPTYGTDSLLV